MKKLKTLAWMFGIAAVMALPMVAAAADVETASPRPDADSLNWVAVLYSAVFAAAIAVVAFKNAKRTHLD
ncbi:MAG: hypothetical protein EHM48_02475 [Planctomycetaceae bacterium]|nr:MAG: hypothetical protein EHM48_02475 [Planctomycetaceae bacterium]